MRYFNQFAAFVLTLACGDLPPTSAGDEPVLPDAGAEPTGAAEPSEFGQLEQALVNLPDGYGTVPNNESIRCWSNGGTEDWPSDCYAPARKTINLVKVVQSCTGTHSVPLTNALHNAVNSMSSMLTQLGWSVQIHSINTNSDLLPQNGRSNFVVGCGSVFSGSSAGALGGTQLSPDLNCDETSAGDLCKYELAKSRLYTSRVTQSGAPFLLGNNTQKEIFARTIFRHEIGHAVGLGHDVCGFGAGETIALAGIGCGWTITNPATWYVPEFTALEKSWLRDFHR
jgi:hypothetical protein